jgi:hypothetical protein
MNGEQCASKVCASGRCATARCDDGVKNGAESDVDCGQPCKRCALGGTCAESEDCASGKCDATCGSTLSLELLCSNRDAMPSCIQPYFRIVNAGSVSVSLSTYSLRYYFTKLFSANPSYTCYYVNNGDCNQLAPARFAQIQYRTGADHYLELAFTAAATSLQPGQFLELQGGFCLPSGETYTQSDDYSFTGSSQYEATDKVALFKDGVLVWGKEP